MVFIQPGLILLVGEIIGCWFVRAPESHAKSHGADTFSLLSRSRKHPIDLNPPVVVFSDHCWWRDRDRRKWFGECYAWVTTRTHNSTEHKKKFIPEGSCFKDRGTPLITAQLRQIYNTVENSCLLDHPHLMGRATGMPYSRTRKLTQSRRPHHASPDL